MSRILDDIKSGKGLSPLLVKSSKDNVTYSDVSPNLINKIEYVLRSKMFISEKDLSKMRDEFVKQLKENGVASVPNWIEVIAVEIPVAFIQEDGTIIRFDF